MSDIKLTRRDLIRASASAAALAAIAPMAYAQQTETLKVGLIGCGARGTGAAADISKSSAGIQITALADIYPDHITRSRESLKKSVPNSYMVTDENCFVGMDAYQKLIATDVDIVLCASYPHFRAKHVEAAVNAGKHVFAEKPIAVDPVGVRRFMKAGEVAKEKGLGILAGTQRRHAPHYRAAIQAVHDGAIGKVTGGSLFFCRAAGRTPTPRAEGESDMAWMLRNWWWFGWLSGDMIAQLVIHQIDIMHWIMGGPCRSAYAFGGKEVYRDPIYGNIFDHFSVCYEYPNGEQFQAHTRQTPGTAGNIGDAFQGGNGQLINAGPQSFILDWNRKPVQVFKQQGLDFVQEHGDFVASIRAGQPLNESKQVAESTLMSLMGQMSAYTGQKIEWDWIMNQSKLDLTPASYEEGEIPPTPVPGKTPLI